MHHKINAPATPGELVRRWVRASPLKHQEIARQLEISPGHLSNVYNEVFPPSDELKVRIKKLMGVDWDALSAREEVA